ncbi:hypothetical protein [Sulfurihydrogenibium sp.]|uniref:hypothetical protein n=1 Tax=Sulfurihydrogenibium sp. TaxID=2053621 RepID=UPI0026043DE5|nr:hypothetical protein [Sulfurihydrogenibium sp.]
MIYYGKYFLVAYILILIQSSIFFKKTFNFFVIPDFALIYIFWLTIENKQTIAKYVGLFVGIFLDLVNPDKTFINTFTYFFSTLYIINLKNNFLNFNFILKLLTVILLSLIVSVPKTTYLFFTTGFLVNEDFKLISFYVLANTVMMYFVYYFDIFVLKRNEV